MYIPQKMLSIVRLSATDANSWGFLVAISIAMLEIAPITVISRSDRVSESIFEELYYDSSIL
jgi:hypothetical protein